MHGAAKRPVWAVGTGPGLKRLLEYRRLVGAGWPAEEAASRVQDDYGRFTPFEHAAVVRAWNAEGRWSWGLEHFRRWCSPSELTVYQREAAARSCAMLALWTEALSLLRPARARQEVHCAEAAVLACSRAVRWRASLSVVAAYPRTGPVSVAMRCLPPGPRRALLSGMQPLRVAADTDGVASACATSKRGTLWRDALFLLHSSSAARLRPNAHAVAHTVTTCAVASHAAAAASLCGLAGWSPLARPFAEVVAALPAAGGAVVRALAASQSWRAALGAAASLPRTAPFVAPVVRAAAGACRYGVHWRGALLLSATADGTVAAVAAAVCGEARQWRGAVRLLRGTVAPAVIRAVAAACGVANQWQAALQLLPDADVHASAVARALAAGRRWRAALRTTAQRGGVDTAAVSDVAGACSAAEAWRQALRLSLGCTDGWGTAAALAAAAEAAKVALLWRLAVGVAADAARQRHPGVAVVAQSACEAAVQWRVALVLERLHDGALGAGGAASAAASEWRTSLGLLRGSSSVVPHTAAVTACGKATLWPVALHVLRRLQRHAPGTPNAAMFNATAHAVVCGAEWRRSLRVLARGEASGCGRDTIAHATAISAFSEGRRWRAAVSTLSAAGSTHAVPDNVMYCSAITAVDRARRWRMSLHLLAVMIDEAVQADVFAWNSAILACGGDHDGGGWRAALLLYQGMGKFSVVADGRTVSSLLVCVAKASKWQRSLALFTMLRGRHGLDSCEVEEAVHPATPPCVRVCCVIVRERSADGDSCTARKPTGAGQQVSRRLHSVRHCASE
eukprot:TRINITY_DN18815_c0_g1_i2.p1 TRINITY_DN18815_c0_g1~~TRINITY_DN18815_c0_g1_i2.p1  ORF type:complete len:795 (+),score=201.63 TRINITY_DN18815_c0_g1_i2:73-2457(+)